jgi:hypothetical protein
MGTNGSTQARKVCVRGVPIDNEPERAVRLGRALRRRGHEVLWATTPKAVLVFLDGTVDVVISGERLGDFAQLLGPCERSSTPDATSDRQIPR